MAYQLHTYYSLLLTEPLVASGLYRVPAMEKAEIRQMINGPESFTPDMHAIMGEAPEVSPLLDTELLAKHKFCHTPDHVCLFVCLCCNYIYYMFKVAF